jgi:hypothetical protein
MIEWIAPSFEILVTLTAFLRENWKKIIFQKKDKFLNYKLRYLFDLYGQEVPVAIHIPYTEMINFVQSDLINESALEITVKPSDFTLQPGKEAWNTIKEKGFTSLVNDKRIRQDANEPVVRLSGVTKTDKTTLVVQKARYNDQARSNLLMDFEHKVHGVHRTFRQYLHDEFDGHLPPIGDERLANSVGIAALILYKEKGVWVPYLLRRTKSLAVFPGTIQCTASGAAKWIGENPSTFKELFTNHMYDELNEEVGLKKEDIQNFHAVALCREFVRGGKPQLVYIGTTELDGAQLAKKRHAAKRVLKNEGGLQEIEAYTWLIKAHVKYKSDAINSSLFHKNVSHETILCLHYLPQYLLKFNLYHT